MEYSPDNHAPQSTPMMRLPPAPTRSRRTLYQRWVEDWWLLELLAALASAGLTVALCVVLWAFDNQQVWTSGSVLHGSITIGTVIALLSTLSVAAAVHPVMECLSHLKWLWFLKKNRPLADMDAYDSASRGASGSLWLLCKLHITASPIASLGALLMIAQLIIAPLAQQSVQFVPQQVPDTNGSAIVRLETTFGEPDFSRSVDQPVGYDRISPYMKGAIYNGLFQSLADPINDTMPLCTTGNCTFDPYQTLGVCYGLKDVSANLRVVDVDPLDVGYPEWKKFCLADTQYCLNLTSFPKEAVPGGVVGSSAGAFPDSFNTTSSLKNFDLNSTTEPLNFSSIAFPRHTNPIADVFIVYQDPDAYEHSQDGFAAIAKEFILDWCVIRMQTEVVNGIAQTTSLNSTTPIFSFDTSKARFGGMVGSVDGIDYGCDNGTHNSLQRYLQRFFNGTMYYDGYGYVADSDILQVLVDSVGSEPADVKLKNPDNLDPLLLTLENLAASMTNYVRIYNPYAPEAKFANGTAFSQRIMVQVSWRWAGAPIFFSGASLLFLILVMSLGFQRHGYGVTPCTWRSSSIATTRSLDAELQTTLGGMVEKSTMHAAAKNLKVRLEWENGAWKLVRALPPTPVGAEKYVQRFTSSSSP